MPEDPSTSTSLIVRTKEGDRQAWNRLFRIYGPLVTYWLRQTDLQPADQDDVAQEVFRTVFKKIATFDTSRVGSTFRGWLRTITRRKVVDLFRQRLKLPKAEGGSEALVRIHQLPEFVDLEPSSGALFDSTLHGLLEFVRIEFEAGTWRAFWETVVEDKPVDMVAEELGKTPAAVRKAKSRVLQRFRKYGREFSVSSSRPSEGA